MKKWQQEDILNRVGLDLVQVNLDQFQPAIEAVTDLYNRNAIADKKLEKVAITAVYDTDTMGFMLGYGQEKQLFTTKITEKLARTFGEYRIDNRDELNKISTMIDQENRIADLSRVLLGSPNLFLTEVNDYINSQLEDLSAEQQQALRFVLARNVAYQFITGCYTGDHHYNHHAESYQAISTDGPTVGQFLPGDQVFGASPTKAGEKLEHITTQCSLMDANSEVNPPYVLFLSQSVRENEDRNNARGLVRDMWRLVTHNEELGERIKAGNLIPIPVLINERTREVLEVVNAAA